MLTVWTHLNPFEPGTTVRADSMNFKLNGIQASFEGIAQYLDAKVINLPASFTGNAYIPNKDIKNSLLLIDAAGNADVYPMATFEQKVTDTANNAASALASKNAAKTSEDNARESELQAAASAELAQTVVGVVVGTVFVAGQWNAGTGAFPTPPGTGSSIWEASTNGVGATADAKDGDLLMYDPINAAWRLYAGLPRVQAAEAAINTNNADLLARINAVQTLAVAGL
jgi:hypothetical protein